MKFIKTPDLKRGMKLAKPIYNRDGVMLYERGSLLTEQGIVSINNFGLIGVYILEPQEPVPPMSRDDIEFERFQAMSIFSIRDILDEIKNEKEPSGLYQFANKIIKEFGMLDRKINFIQSLRSISDYIYKHSLNTAILSAMMSHFMKLSFKEQLDVVIAALVHDAGSLNVPLPVRRKPEDRLTEDDKNTIQAAHMKFFSTISDQFEMDPEVKNILRSLLYSIHGIRTASDTSIVVNHDAVEVVRVAACYDEMTAMKLDEEPMSEIAAIRFLMDEKNGYAQNVVAALTGSINLLKPALMVELTNGEKGLIIDGNDQDILSPKVLSFSTNEVYDLADAIVSRGIGIKDIVKTLDNRFVINTYLLDTYRGKTVHIGEKLDKSTF
ncbi:MAG: HD domain-containing protein [Lachnospiraceae bacterium]|jgi:HD-GYP domain-containing protein (c-di-GMP phosphodiesterase class II)|nr:HD domain-containing protein [Lachnospiraceae bacterium]MEE3460770.1 HD domain-containing protein [Lachnospiraceae bacterium]